MTNDSNLLYRAGMSHIPRENADESLGATVRYLREQAGLSQAELARQMTEREWPWHQSTTYRVESGRQSLRLAEAIDLASILKVPLQWLTMGVPTVNATATVYTSLSRLHTSWRQASSAVVRLLADIQGAERTLAQYLDSEYEQAREASRELEAELSDSSLEAAIADGIARWDGMRESGDEAEPGSVGPFGIAVDDDGRFFLWESDPEPGDEDAAPGSDDAAARETEDLGGQEGSA